MKNIKTYAIIPAKAHSSRLPGKNLKDLCGKPMIAYIIESALATKEVDKVFVSTDSKRIEKVAKKYGASVISRPRRLTQDNTTSQEVVAHAIGQLEKRKDTPDFIVLLYPTSPLLKSEVIDSAISLAKKSKFSVATGYLDKKHYWIQGLGDSFERLYPKEVKNSQFQSPLFVEDGAVYVTRTSVMKKQVLSEKIYPFIVEQGSTIDVDYPEDFKKVEEILKKSI